MYEAGPVLPRNIVNNAGILHMHDQVSATTQDLTGDSTHWPEIEGADLADLYAQMVLAILSSQKPDPVVWQG